MPRYPIPPFARFWRGLDSREKIRLAFDADVQYPYLSMIANGHRRAGKATIQKLTAADPRITADMLGRSDLA